MQGAEKGGAVVVGAQVGPRRHGGGAGGDGVEDDAAGEGEDGVAEQGGDAFELGVKVVGGAGAKGGACRRVFRVQGDKPCDVGGRVAKVVCAQVVDDLLRGADVVGEEAKERAFVLLVAEDEGDFGKVACGGGQLGRGREKGPVRSR